jgi:hypothetical protein
MNRMFQVIVAGGFSLTAYACGSSVKVAAAGAASGSGGGTAQTTGGGFPQEGGLCIPGESTGPSCPSGAGGFPQEGAASSSTSGMGGFPQEGPAFPDGGSDADGDDGMCFPPEETAFACPDGSAAMSDAGDAGDAHFPQEGPM